MAKRKDKSSEEEDWFDDDFEEEEKPKKKSRRKKKKGGKIIAWVVAFIVILAVLLFIRFKYTAPVEEAPVQEEAPADVVQEVYVPEPETDKGEQYVPPKETGPDVVEKDDFEKVREVIDTTTEPKLFSNVVCNYDYDAGLLYINLRIYNTLDEDIKISPRGVNKGYNTYFLIRGLVDQDPGCQTELVKPGEWTECKRIGFDNLRYGNVEGVNRISVQVPGRTEALLVDCPAMPTPAEEEV